MKKHIFMIIICLTSTLAYGQGVAIVTDPTSMSQRAIQFMQEMEEAIEQRTQMLKQVAGLKNIYEQNSELIEYSKKASFYVQSSKEILQIIDLGTQAVKKQQRYRNEISHMEYLTKEERYYTVCALILVADKIKNLVSSGRKMVHKNDDKSGRFSDYERLSMIKDVKNDLYSTINTLDNVYYTAVNKNSYYKNKSEMRKLTEDFMTFNF